MTAAPTPAAPPHLAAIDAMRGYAILGVVLTHAGQWTKPTSEWAVQLCRNGALGVQLFFVASAFALFLSNETRRPAERRPVADFFVRRFFRVAPMFYVGLVGFVLLVGLGPRFWAPRGLDSAHVMLTALFLHGWHPETINSVVPGGWSIAAETSFYLLLPLLFKFVPTRAWALRLLVITLVLGPLMNAWLAPLLTPNYPARFAYLAENFKFFWIFGELPVFACGILLYYLQRESRDRPDRRIGWACLAAFLLSAGALFWQMPPVLPPSLFVTAAYGTAFLLFGLALHHLRSPLLVNPLVVFFGKISYSLYFVHFAVMQFFYLQWHDGLPFDGPLVTPLAFLMLLIVAGAISWATWQAIELPGIALGRRLVARLEARVS
ncbi:MAG: acyltransferase [Lacunisphaera sp.]|nr:acyltransferase [Lacunisphaera sp.]